MSPAVTTGCQQFIAFLAVCRSERSSSKPTSSARDLENMRRM
jgi:hypothetical protein